MVVCHALEHPMMMLKCSFRGILLADHPPILYSLIMQNAADSFLMEPPFTIIILAGALEEETLENIWVLV